MFQSFLLKGKSSLNTPWGHGGGVEVQLHSFLTSALDGGMVGFKPWPHYPRGTHSIEGWITSRGRVKSLPWWVLNHDSLVAHLTLWSLQHWFPMRVSRKPRAPNNVVSVSASYRDKCQISVDICQESSLGKWQYWSNHPLSSEMYGWVTKASALTKFPNLTRSATRRTTNDWSELQCYRYVEITQKCDFKCSALQ